MENKKKKTNLRERQRAIRKRNVVLMTIIAIPFIIIMLTGIILMAIGSETSSETLAMIGGILFCGGFVFYFATVIAVCIIKRISIPYLGIFFDKID